jgi:hypothetical protein
MIMAFIAKNEHGDSPQLPDEESECITSSIGHNCGEGGKRGQKSEVRGQRSESKDSEDPDAFSHSDF